MRVSSLVGVRFLTAVFTTWAGVLVMSGVVVAGSPAFRDDDIKLTGCLIRGEGDPGGYLLTNAPDNPVWSRTDKRTVAPSAVGTTGGFTTIFYWLHGSNDLNAHVGQRVEIDGDLQGDVRDGEIKTHRKDNWTELTLKVNGRSMKARVPNASFMFASDRDDKNKSDVLVRRVNVEHVKMIGAGCRALR
jgi:hypothetical protein